MSSDSGRLNAQDIPELGSKRSGRLVLEAQGLHRNYGPVVAVGDLDLSMSEGDDRWPERRREIYPTEYAVGGDAPHSRISERMRR